MCDIMFTIHVGDKVTSILSSLDRVGMIVCQAKSAEAAVAQCIKAKEKVMFEIE